MTEKARWAAALLYWSFCSFLLKDWFDLATHARFMGVYPCSMFLLFFHKIKKNKEKKNWRRR
jgi:hypothetical protein